MPLRHPVPKPILAAIGDITVSFALLESELQQLAWSQIRDSQRVTQVVTAMATFSELRTLVLSLYLSRNGEGDARLPALRELISRAATLATERNQIIHALWAAGEDSTTVTRIATTARERRGLRIDFKQVSAEALTAVALEMRDLAQEIQGFRMALIDAGKARE